MNVEEIENPVGPRATLSGLEVERDAVLGTLAELMCTDAKRYIFNDETVTAKLNKQQPCYSYILRVASLVLLSNAELGNHATSFNQPRAVIKLLNSRKFALTSRHRTPQSSDEGRALGVLLQKHSTMEP